MSFLYLHSIIVMPKQINGDCGDGDGDCNPFQWKKGFYNLKMTVSFQSPKTLLFSIQLFSFTYT